MLVAEELDANWDRVIVRQADNDPAAYGDQGVGGSDSVMSGFTLLRQAGALGRWLIVGAAADAWHVSPQQCRTGQSQVVNVQTGATLSYGQLAAAAALRALPAKPPALKDPATFQLIGTSRSGVGNHDIVRGRAIYRLDVHFPGMLYAVIEKCPVFGGRVRSVMDADARAVQGVRDVVRVEGAPRHIWLRPGVAVIAESTWAAMRGRAALRVTWDEGPGATESSNAIRGRLVAASRRKGKILRKLGDPDRALAQAAVVVDATYELPFLPHLTMEPMNCAAHVHDGRCEIWGPMQLPERAREVVAAVIGMPKAAIHVRMSRLGGGFGRRLLSDYAAEAAYLSKKTGTPVQVIWTREDDIRHDYYRPAAIHRVRAAVAAFE
jgi:isoquinoline 1-oxidoreductase beta subunit